MFNGMKESLLVLITSYNFKTHICLETSKFWMQDRDFIPLGFTFNKTHKHLSRVCPI